MVLRFGGVSSGKFGGTMGCDGGRTRGPGEHPRDEGAEFRPFAIIRPVKTELPVITCGFCVGFRRVGVDGLEFERKAGELTFVGV